MAAQLPKSLRLQVGFFARGFRDACRFRLTIETLRTNKAIQNNVIKSSVVQVLLLASVFAFDHLVLPLILSRRDVDGLGGKASLYYELFWLYPLLGLSFYLSGLFNTNIAERMQAFQTGQLPGQSSSDDGLTSKALSMLCRALLVLQALGVSFLLARIPFVGKPLSLLYLCPVDAYYCFEHRWVATGWSLSERVQYMEERWAYFTGFGMPITAISFFHGSTFANLALFTLAFPVYLVMSSGAEPLPVDPRSPSASSLLPSEVLSPDSRSSEDDLAPWMPVRLPVLRLAVEANDMITRQFPRMTKGVKKSSDPRTSHSVHQHYPQHYPPPAPSYISRPSGFAEYGPRPTSAAQDPAGRGTSYSVSRQKYLAATSADPYATRRRRGD